MTPEEAGATSLQGALRQVAGDLDDIGARWALVGALGVAAWAEARATLDIDVAVAVAEQSEATSLVANLRRRGYRWRANLGAAMSSLLLPQGPPGGLRLDLLFRLAGIEDEVAHRAVRMAVLPGLELPVARRGDLLALKLLASDQPGRDHDRRDARALLANALPSDVEEARSAIALLGARGYADPRRLHGLLDDLLVESRVAPSRLN